MDYTMWIPTTSNSDEPPQEDDNHQPPSSSLSSLPNDVVLSCLVRIPRIYDLNVSRVSKSLKSLVRSPELDRLRSLFQKDSLYLCFRDNIMSPHCHWFSFCQNETKTDIDYQLVPVPFPSHPFMLYSSTVVVGSYIYFIGGPLYRSKNLLILDTVSGQVRVGPSMKVARYARKTVVEVVDGKIYVIGGCDEEIQVEVFDPESQKWEFATKEKMRCISGFSASLEGKVYVVEEDGKLCVYNPREGLRKEILTKKKRKRDETTEIRLNGSLNCVCVIDNVLYACSNMTGVMWFDTKLNEWRSLVPFQNWLVPFDVDAMVEYKGKLAVLWSRLDSNEKKKNIRCKLIALDRVGERIRGKIEWSGSGIVATVPYTYSLMHCLLVSNKPAPILCLNILSFNETR